MLVQVASIVKGIRSGPIGGVCNVGNKSAIGVGSGGGLDGRHRLYCMVKIILSFGLKSRCLVFLMDQGLNSGSRKVKKRLFIFAVEPAMAFIASPLPSDNRAELIL